ncbi:cell division protein FtsH [Sporanaerobium hydrogeniformans]|uniref:Cell division protein FtsH n=1 Tax=Sporanaerobium hydrogeniformans TaxID=3072179 RepID=A0AC61DFC2_9FIRM|nr:FtsH/Yme1/Tma family ATP-dependent metallopeptidase [Sporanaerobium hydrogeniformans]PHV71984.1 cell division protein FtsH [Sporanaerobium hydrogeniformans]
MRRKRVFLMSGIILGVLLLMGGITWNKHSKPVQMSYNEFISKVENKQIEEVILSSEAKLHFKQYGEDISYETDNPRTQSFKEKLLLNNVKVIEKTTTQFDMVQSVISLAFMVAMFTLIFKMVSKQGMSKGAMSLNSKPIEANELKQDFNNIAGNEEAKEQVQDIIDFMKNPEKYAKLGARMPKGIILYGPPGTGKTLMAKAIAKEAGVAFFSVSGSDFVQLYVGVGASRVREIFGEARKHKKAVIFIDEIDAIGKKRSQSAQNSNDEKDQTLNALLTEMSGFREDEGIVIIAATNRLDMLDDALLRPGRFDRHIEVGYPDLAAREAILKLHIKNKPLSEDINLKELAKQTVYFSGAMLENLVNEAAISAAKEDQKVITKEGIDSAFYTVIAGKEKKDRSGIDRRERKVTAFHEAGHTLITKLVAPENSITKVTIIPSTKGAGGFSMNIPKDKMYHTKQDILNQIKVSLGGRAAEELIFGKDFITTGASNDLERASGLIKDYLMRYGMDEEFGLVNWKVLLGEDKTEGRWLLEKASTHLNKLYEECKQILINHKEVLELLAEALLEKETLDEQEIANFFT